MERALTSDELGKKGEHRFPEICVDDGLIPNPSSWDRKGWDFAVDWRFAPEAGSYDSRPTPPSCLVQVKTVWDDTGSIEVRLSSIEHLAKDVKPAFIVVLRVKPDQSYAESRIAHLKGDLLAHVLKALRKAQAKGQKVNEVDLSLALDKWFEPLTTGNGQLRRALEAAIGPSMGDYVDRKQMALRELGFDQGHMTLQTTLRAQSMDAITDAFLGLSSIEAVDVSGAETRFGISLPIPDLSRESTTFKFEPKAHDTCKIVVRIPNGNKAFDFKGEMFGLPRQLKAEHFKVLIRTSLFSLVLRAEDVKVGLSNFTMNLTVDQGSVGKAKLPAKEWATFYGFLDALARERLAIELKPKKMKVPISGHIELNRSEKHDENEYAFAARLTAIAAAMFERSQWPSVKLKIEEIGAARRGLFALDQLMDKPDGLTPLSFSTEAQEVSAEDEIELLYFNYIVFGEHALVYAASCSISATIEGDLAHWKSGVLQFRDIARIKARPSDFNKFVTKVERITGIQSRFVPDMMASQESKQ